MGCIPRSRVSRVVSQNSLISAQIHDGLIAAVLDCLYDEDDAVRREAAKTISEVLYADDDDAIAMAVLGFDHSDPHIRKAAVQVLGCACDAGNKHALAALTHSLRDSDPEIRIAAISGLRRMAGALPIPGSVGYDGGISPAGVDKLFFAIGPSCEDKYASVRLTAIKTMVRSMSPGDRRLMEIVVRHLSDEVPDVRDLCVATLRQAVRPPDGQEAIDAVIERFGHPLSPFRDYAMKALIEVAKGDRRAIAALIDFIGAEAQNETPTARAAALEALAQVAEQGNSQRASQRAFPSPAVESALVTIIACLREDQADSVRLAAAKAISKVARRGNERALEAAQLAIKDSSPHMRLAAIEILCKVVVLGEDHGIAEIISSLKDDSVTVRLGALKALAASVEKGNPRAIEEMRSALGDASAEVQQMAMQALSQVAKPGDDAVIDTLIAKLNHANPAIRLAAIEAIRRMATKDLTEAFDIDGKDDEQVISALWAVLADEDPQVWRAAIVAISAVMPNNGGDRVIHQIKLRLGRADENSRLSALEALNALAGKGSKAAVAAITNVFSDKLSEPAIRQLAIEMLGKLVENANGKSFAAPLAACLADQHQNVRDAAAKVLRDAAQTGDPQITSPVANLLEHSDVSVRECAVQALSLVSVSDSDELVANILCRLEPNVAEDIQISALQALAQVARKDDAKAINAALLCYENGEERAQIAALQALPQLVFRGADEEVVKKIAHKLALRGATVRVHAVTALGHIAERGCHIARPAIIARFEDEVPDVRAAAVPTLTQLSITMVMQTRSALQFPQLEGDEEVTRALIKRLNEDNSSAVRLAALEAIGRLSRQYAAMDVHAGGFGTSSDEIVRRGSAPRSRRLSISTDIFSGADFAI